MGKLNSYFLLLMLTLSFSCDRKNEADLLFADSIYSGEPIFYFSASNQEYKIEAGVNGFYLFTEFEVDDMDVYGFIARFAKLSSCTLQCEEELVIKIRDFQPADTNSQVAINEALSVGDYSFTNSQSISFGDVLIEYTDKDGRTFRTDLADQNVESNFQILEVSDFQQNENGQATKKLTIAFRCTLRDPIDGIEISFEDADAVIAVAYPE